MQPREFCCGYLCGARYRCAMIPIGGRSPWVLIIESVDVEYLVLSAPLFVRCCPSAYAAFRLLTFTGRSAAGFPCISQQNSAIVWAGSLWWERVR